MIDAIITDIEGTTSSLSFVKDTLFPYASEHLADFVYSHQHCEDVTAILRAVDLEIGRALNVDESIAQLLAWAQADQKITPLKSLQGLIWQKGYVDGDFKGHIYFDALTALQNWHQKGIALYVYSSGSISAQKLLFAHTEYGDVNPVFSGYFDTTIGGKKAAFSYRAIVEHIQVAADRCLFLSDIIEELDAAKQAGLQTCQIVRDSATQPGQGHQFVSNFSQIQLIH